MRAISARTLLAFRSGEQRDGSSRVTYERCCVREGQSCQNASFLSLHLYTCTRFNTQVDHGLTEVRTLQYVQADKRTRAGWRSIQVLGGRHGKGMEQLLRTQL